MIQQKNRKAVRYAFAEHEKARENLKKTRELLLDELRAARMFGAKLHELGSLMGVSKQRVSQMLKEDE